MDRRNVEPCPRRLDVDLFRGVNKVYLEQYVIIFQWYYNLKTVTDEFLRVLLGCTGTTKFGYMSHRFLAARPCQRRDHASHDTRR